MASERLNNITSERIHRSIVFILIAQSAGVLTVSSASALRLLRLFSARKKIAAPMILAAIITPLILAVNEALTFDLNNRKD